MLKPNTCLEEIYVSAKDSALVQESLELLVAILKLRPLLLGQYNPAITPLTVIIALYISVRILLFSAKPQRTGTRRTDWFSQ